MCFARADFPRSQMPSPLSFSSLQPQSNIFFLLHSPSRLALWANWAAAVGPYRHGYEPRAAHSADCRCFRGHISYRAWKNPSLPLPPPSSQSHPSISFSTPLLPIFLIWLLSPPVHSRLKGQRRNTNAHAQNGYQQQGLSTLAGIHKSLKRLQMLSYRETSTGY